MVAKIIEFLKIVWIVMCALLFCGHPVVRRSNRFWSYYRVANNRAYIPKCIVQFWSWNKLLSVIMSSSSNPSFNCSCVGPGQVRVFRMKENSIRQNLTSSFQLIIKRLLSLKNHPSGKWQKPPLRSFLRMTVHIQGNCMVPSLRNPRWLIVLAKEDRRRHSVNQS